MLNYDFLRGMRELLGALIKIQAPLRFAARRYTKDKKPCFPRQPRDRAGGDEQRNGVKARQW